MDLPSVRSEIVELHEVFVRWFRADQDQDFARIEAALADGFTYVTTTGEVIDRTDLIEQLEQGHGSRDLPIRIENVSITTAIDSVVVATYEEWHDHPDHSTGRQSTAVFSRDDTAPHGIVWRHVHETWIVPPPSA